MLIIANDDRYYMQYSRQHLYNDLYKQYAKLRTLAHTKSAIYHSGCSVDSGIRLHRFIKVLKHLTVEQHPTILLKC